MKQAITIKQWYEIWSEANEELRVKLLNDYFPRIEYYASPSEIFNNLPTIGDLIEFLGDDLVHIEFFSYNGCEVKIKTNKLKPKYQCFVGSELTILLWEAVKYKICHKD